MVLIVIRQRNLRAIKNLKKIVFIIMQTEYRVNPDTLYKVTN